MQCRRKQRPLGLYFPDCDDYPSLICESGLENLYLLCRAECRFYYQSIFLHGQDEGRSLEELDVIFAAPGDPVKNEKRMLHDISVSKARRILGLDDTITEASGDEEENFGAKNTSSEHVEIKA
jgi:hypothetical protein